MKVKIFIILIIIMLFSIGIYGEVQKKYEEQYNILFLNSYHDGYIWTNDVKHGILETINENFSNVKLRIEYMDTKNCNEEGYFEILYDYYEYKYKNIKFDAIISSDDNALMFLLTYRQDLFKDVPIFFCGINNISEYNLGKENNIYGVGERSSSSETLAVAISQNKNVENIYIIIEESVTGKATKLDIRNALEIESANYNIEFVDGQSFFDILEFVKEISVEDSIVFHTFYVVDFDGTVHEVEESARKITEISSVPVYGLWSFGFGNGTVGGKLVSGFYQGKRVVEIYMNYLDGLYKSNYYEDNSANKHMYDYNVMKKYNLNIDLIPKDSVVINMPESFIEKYQVPIIVISSVIIVMVIYLFILRIQIAQQTKKINITQKRLLKSEEMASLGQLVVGVAHEINTPVGTCITTTSYLAESTACFKEKYSKGKLTKNDLEKNFDSVIDSTNIMADGLNQIVRIVESLKKISVNNNNKLTDVNLLDEINYVIKTLKNELEIKNCIVEINCAKTISILSYMRSIEIVLSNLINNSLIHGIKDDTKALININVKESYDKIIINYLDNGKGMTTSELNHIYEPFYTTNRDGKNVGLGMNIVYNHVTRILDGSIKISDDDKSGINITIELPKKIK